MNSADCKHPDSPAAALLCAVFRAKRGKPHTLEKSVFRFALYERKTKHKKKIGLYE